VKNPPELVALRIEQRVAELQLLAAATAVVWGRSPGLPFEAIADEAQNDARRFIERTRRALGVPAESPGTPTIRVCRTRPGRDVADG
jgi:hypothetical protein